MRTRDNLVIDTAVLAIYLLAANPRVTGISAHEWVSLGFGVLAATHLLLHRDWVARVVTGLLSRASTRSKALLALDGASGLAVTTVMVSGLAVSRAVVPALGLTWATSPVWRAVHAGSAVAVLALALAHVAAHWRWIVTACRLHVIAPLRGTHTAGLTAPAAARAIALGIPALVVAALGGLAALGITSSGSATTAYAGSAATGQTLTCPATGCTATSCHATSGQRGGGGAGHTFGG